MPFASHEIHDETALPSVARRYLQSPKRSELAPHAFDPFDTSWAPISPIETIGALAQQENFAFRQNAAAAPPKRVSCARIALRRHGAVDGDAFAVAADFITGSGGHALDEAIAGLREPSTLCFLRRDIARPHGDDYTPCHRLTRSEIKPDRHRRTMVEQNDIALGHGRRQ